MGRDEEIRRREKAAETFDKMAEHADNNVNNQRKGWDGSANRQNAENARNSADKLRREK